MGSLSKTGLLVGIVLVLLLTQSPPSSTAATALVADNSSSLGELKEDQFLSPYWSHDIKQWGTLIAPIADTYGLDPDFVAAVVKAESNGLNNVVSNAGAVGLMGIMPSGPGMEWRPSTEELANPGLNLDWGVAILSEIILDAGGDLYAALAAYSAGWDYVNRRVPQEYAARVLDDYGRAIAARSGIAPEIGVRWTVALEIRRGHIPHDSPPLILGEEPVSGFYKFGEHVVFNATDERGHTYYIKGYAVPLALAVPEEEALRTFGSSDTLEPELMRHLPNDEMKASRSNPRVLLACLPSLSRLRGRASTRWFAPSFCPSWHR